MDRDVGRTSSIFKRLGAIALLGALGGLAGPAAAQWGSPTLASIEVYDRYDGTTLPVYDGNGGRWVVGTPGHEYTLRIRNLGGERILAVTSVDGVNVVSGETASPDQSGYVIDGYGSVEISGWRKSLQRTAAFYFTDLGDSYAARTGRPGNVGVIGVAVFRERPRPIAYRPLPREKIAGADRAGAAADSAQAAAPSGSASEPAPPPMEQRESARDEVADARRGEIAAKRQSPLGTGHGRNEASYATRVSFERATSTPAEMVSVRYDRRETLAAMGVLPGDAYIARRAPEPFPGLRFVPDPR